MGGRKDHLAGTKQQKYTVQRETLVFNPTAVIAVGAPRISADCHHMHPVSFQLLHTGKVNTKSQYKYYFELSLENAGVVFKS